MDHLLFRPTPKHSRIEVPFLNGKPYEGPFDSFPERNGWTKIQIVSPNLAQGKIGEVKHLVQEWLFFGIALEVFGSATKRDHWIRHRSDGEVVLTSAYLRSLIVQLHQQLKLDTKGDGRSRIHSALQISADIVNKLSIQDHPLAMSGELLVIAILSDTIHKSFAPTIDVYRPSGLLDLSVSKPIQKRMVEDGWCKRDVYRLSHQLDLESFYLASSLDPPEAHVSHSHCTELECIRSKVDEKAYVSQHVTPACDGTCKFIGVDEAELADILLSGDIPLVCYRSNPGPNDRISLVRAAPGTQYVAISHVWSHGLGNHHNNAIPRCQFQRIGELVLSLQHHKKGEPPLFWLDTICFPLHHQQAADCALIGMRRSYEDASAVLVLDRYLEGIEQKKLLRTECFVRILVSSWTRRLWTLQEGALARKLYFNFADDILETERAMLIQTAEMVTLIYDDSIEYQSISSSMSNLWDYWKTAKSDSSRHLLNSFGNELRFRDTSVAVDESLCLTTLAGLDMEKLLKTQEQGRMAAFWSLLPSLSVQCIFWSGPRLGQKGYRWAPASFLHQTGSNFQDVQIQSTLETEGAGSAFCTEQGLRFSCPGILLNTWRATLGRQIWIRDHLGRWYLLRRLDSDEIPVPKQNDEDMQTLVVILKLPLEESFHGSQAQTSVSCVIACLHDVDEEKDILYARTIGNGLLLPADQISGIGVVQSIVDTAEVKLGVCSAASSVFTPPAVVINDPGLNESEGNVALRERQFDDSGLGNGLDNIAAIFNRQSDRLKARYEGDRVAVDIRGDHFMFDVLDLDLDQSWCLD